MSLVFLTGAARSGKSAAALSLALRSETPVTVIVFGRGDDPEMRDRIARHQADRPAGWRTVEAHDDEALLTAIESDDCILFDCLGTFVGSVMESEITELGVADAFEADVVPRGLEIRVEARVDRAIASLLDRTGRTIVVSNEVGSGVVPATWSGRLFRDIVGRANRRLASEAAAAYLVTCGRCQDLGVLPEVDDLSWPQDIL